MALIQGKDTETTTLLQVIQAAEASQSNHFDLIHLELDSGRELILAAVLADDLEATGRILEGLQVLQSAQ